MPDALIAGVEQKKARLDLLRPTSPGALTHLEHAHDLKLTYTSNAIEGNRLTQAETGLVIDQGITVWGKPLKDHLEVIDHHDAVLYVRAIARRREPPTESDVRSLYALVVRRSDPATARSYADRGRYVNTDAGRHRFPAPAELPALMSDFAGWLRDVPDTPATAFSAHRRLVDIHPFNDGNGRIARLVMSLVLIRGGYPPIAVRPADRLAYLRALQQAQAGQGAAALDRLLYERLDATLGEYLNALREALPRPDPPLETGDPKPGG